MKEKSITNEFSARVKSKLEFLYPGNSSEIYQKLIYVMEKYQNEIIEWERKNWVDEQDVFVITYGDNIQESGEAPLKTLKEFFDKYLYQEISGVHILPFFPYSSDDGFAVKNYTEVNHELGNWDHIRQISSNYRLMVDAVINHVSSKSKWAKKYFQGEKKYQDYFIEVDPSKDLSHVTRPRSNPLLTEFDTISGHKHLWTTFGPDQLDLNFKNPKVLLEIVEILLFYLTQGADVIRLDAIAYLWKKIETKCIHLEETHIVVKLFRDILSLIAPEVLIITETNVPHEENISYFGNGYDEAHMVYQFSLPPLVLYSFVEENASKLSQWAEEISAPTDRTTFFNFLASHDGIGVRPAEGILTENEIKNLCQITREKGGAVKYKNDGDGDRSPYELNITYVDAIIDENEPLSIQVDKFMASQAILLSFKGVPGIYIHSLLGSRNFYEGVEKTGMKRKINREKLDLNNLEKELENSNTLRHKIFYRYKKLLRLRKRHKAFHPNGRQKIIHLDKRIFSVLRKYQNEEILALHNVSSQNINIILELNDFKLSSCDKLINIINEQEYKIENQMLNLNIDPYQVAWLKKV